MRDTTTNPAPPSRPTGRAITLLLIPTASPVALVPAWAVLCGACAAGNGQWKHLDTFDPHSLIALALAVLIVEALWNTWRALLVDVNWADDLARRPLPTPDALAPALPYTTPWSPLGRLFRRWRQVRHQCENAPVEKRGALFTLPLLPLLILTLSAVVGWPMVVLSIAALSLSCIEWRVARRSRTHAALQAGMQVGLGWLAGHSVLQALTWTSFTLACCYAVAYQGALTMDQETTAAQNSRRAWPLALLYVGQVAALTLLALLQRPLAATLLGLLLAPQLLLLARLKTAAHNVWYLRHAIPFLMAAMVIAAWAM